MFGVEHDVLIENLEKLRRWLCAYGGGGLCDCKFGANGGGEQTGCPEIRQAIKLLKGQQEEVILLRARLENSAVNALAKIRHVLKEYDKE